MRFVADRDELLDALHIGVAVAEHRTTMPALSSVLLRCKAGSLTIAATDLSTTMIATVSVTGAGPGGVTVPAKRLLDVVRGLPAGPVNVTSIDGGKVEVKAGRQTYLLVGERESDFPALPNVPTAFAPVHPAPLHRLFKRVSHAICDDASRMHINCVRLEQDGGRVRSVTTDGHQLATAREDIGWQLPRAISVVGPTVPKVLALLDEAPEAGAAIEGRHMWIRRGAVCLCVILGEENFPPWSAVVPKAHVREATVIAADFAGAVKRLTGMISRSAKSGDGVTFRFGGGHVVMSAKGDGIGEGEEIVPLGWEGDDLEIGLSAAYVLETVAALGGESMRLQFGDAVAPVVFLPKVGDDFMGIVMPMRL